jgi:MoxR-like ATPase
MTKANSWDQLFTRLIDDGTIPGAVNRVLLYGPPRTGKSTLPGTKLQNVQRVTLHRQMPVDDLIGGMGLVNGSTQWMDGPATRAMRQGSALVIDEVDQFSAEIRCMLHAIMDDPAGVTLPTGERVDAQPGYCVIATTNALPSALPDALYDRFDMVLKADTLSAGLLNALGSFATAAERVVHRGTDYAWERPASVNLFIAAAKLRAKGIADVAIAECLGLTGNTATDFLAAIADR